MSNQDKIIIRGARMHNLKDVSLEIPHNKLAVMTGVSGSGKSSLAFDTIFAEGQRRYIESLSPYARQFLGQMKPADVDEINAALLDRGIIGGYDLGIDYPALKDHMLIAITEKISREDIDYFCEVLKEFSNDLAHNLRTIIPRP